MPDSPPRDLSPETEGPDSGATTRDDLAELRRILLEPTETRVRRLQESLEAQTLDASTVGRLLPDAIVLRNRQDKKLNSALMPAVEEIVQASVQRDPRPLADALFPVIGPAIRKAIAETFRRMIQSLNQTLEQSLSRQGIRWRIEALRTGKSFGEVVLLHSLVYRVEQVFLIHRTSGLLLHHVVAEAVPAQDSDMVSGMLTAIQDFVRDSFHMQKSDALQTIQVGDLVVWVEQGPQAILAAVIRGNAPEDLRVVVQEALESIHLETGEALEGFDGDTAPFDPTRRHLEECLLARYKEKKKGLSPLFWLFMAILAGVLGCLAFLFLRGQSRWANCLDRLQAEPGIVVTEAGREGGGFFVSGLRDPLAAAPAELIRSAGMAPEDVRMHWEPYQALDPPFVLARAGNLLRPPPTAYLRLDGGRLLVEGSASAAWVREAQRLVGALAGVEELDVSGLRDERDEEVRAFDQRVAWLERQRIRFPVKIERPPAGSDEKLDEIASGIRSLLDLGALLNKTVRVEISGHTDSVGTEEDNLRLSEDRARGVREDLVARGIPFDRLVVVGKGATDPLREELTEEDRAVNRRVGFRALVGEPVSGGAGSR